MSEELRLGKVTCNYIDGEEFLSTGRQWLNENKFHHIVTLNPEMVMLAEHDSEFRSALDKASLRVPDGSGLIWAHWYIRSKFWSLIPSLISFSFRSAERITGVDTVINLSGIAQREQKNIYLLGSGREQLKKTTALLEKRYPGVKITSSPSHKFDISGPKTIIDDINQSRATLLFVAYGAPKQSVWIERNKLMLPYVRVAIGVGGAFDILSETKKRAPKLFLRLNLEWLWRLFLEPSRLPRIWQAVVKFPRLVQQQKSLQS